MKTKAFIHGMGMISPQKEMDLMTSPLAYSGTRMVAVEPEYSDFLDPKVMRRMSRVIKMGVATATMALKGAGAAMPDAIITGTGYGCLEDSGIFMAKMIEKKETPTPFIHSTHNTIGSQIALTLQCYGYNQTYTHRGHSFEHALLDAMMQTADARRMVLVGAVDEITEYSQTILERFEFFKVCENSLQLFGNGNGTINGEGACSFAISPDASPSGVGVESVQTFFRPPREKLLTAIADIQREFGSIDLVLSGKCGDDEYDQALSVIADHFDSIRVGYFKHLCGEYPTASAFATWLAARVLESQKLPSVVAQHVDRPLKNILIFNQYLGRYVSMILVTK